MRRSALGDRVWVGEAEAVEDGLVHGGQEVFVRGRQLSLLHREVRVEVADVTSRFLTSSEPASEKIRPNISCFF